MIIALNVGHLDKNPDSLQVRQMTLLASQSMLAHARLGMASEGQGIYEDLKRWLLTHHQNKYIELEENDPYPTAYLVMLDHAQQCVSSCDPLCPCSDLHVYLDLRFIPIPMAPVRRWGNASSYLCPFGADLSLPLCQLCLVRIP